MYEPEEAIKRITLSRETAGHERIVDEALKKQANRGWPESSFRIQLHDISDTGLAVLGERYAAFGWKCGTVSDRSGSYIDFVCPIPAKLQLPRNHCGSSGGPS